MPEREQVLEPKGTLLPLRVSVHGRNYLHFHVQWNPAGSCVDMQNNYLHKCLSTSMWPLWVSTFSSQGIPWNTSMLNSKHFPPILKINFQQESQYFLNCVMGVLFLLLTRYLSSLWPLSFFARVSCYYGKNLTQAFDAKKELASMQPKELRVPNLLILVDSLLHLPPYFLSLSLSPPSSVYKSLTDSFFPPKPALSRKPRFYSAIFQLSNSLPQATGLPPQMSRRYRLQYKVLTLKVNCP